MLSLLEGCLYWRGFRTREMSVSERRVYQKDVCIREMSALEMSVLERCLYQGDVYIREVSILERCLY